MPNDRPDSEAVSRQRESPLIDNAAILAENDRIDMTLDGHDIAVAERAAGQGAIQMSSGGWPTYNWRIWLWTVMARIRTQIWSGVNFWGSDRERLSNSSVIAAC